MSQKDNKPIIITNITGNQKIDRIRVRHDPIVIIAQTQAINRYIIRTIISLFF